jgi:hypothetical protein
MEYIVCVTLHALYAGASFEFPAIDYCHQSFVALLALLIFGGTGNFSFVPFIIRWTAYDALLHVDVICKLTLIDYEHCVKFVTRHFSEVNFHEV